MIRSMLILLIAATLLQGQVIKTGTLAPEGSPWHETIKEMSAEWSQHTDGDVSFRIYAGGILGDESDMVRKLRIGQLHAAALSAEGLIYIIPEFDVFRLPMFIRSADELDPVIVVELKTVKEIG